MKYLISTPAENIKLPLFQIKLLDNLFKVFII